MQGTKENVHWNARLRHVSQILYPQTIVGAKSVYQLNPSEIFIPTESFEVGSFMHFGLKQFFNIAAVVVHTLKCSLENGPPHLVMESWCPSAFSNPN